MRPRRGFVADPPLEREVLELGYHRGLPPRETAL